MAPPNPFWPRILDGVHAPHAPAIHLRQGAGRGPRHRPLFPPDLPFPQARHEVDQGVQPDTPDPRARWRTRNITPSPARRAMRDPPTSEHMILENVTSKGRGSRDECATRADTHDLRENYTPRHQVTGRPQRHHWGNFSAHNLRECCEGHVPCSPESYQHQ